MNITPFTWGIIPGLFSPGAFRTLTLTFPEDGFAQAGDGSPGFRFLYRPLIRKGVVPASVSGLDEIWYELAEMLGSMAYISSLCDLVSVPRQSGWTIDAGLCVYTVGCALKPHTDRPMRILSQVTYLNQRWEPSWGGTLRVLRSDRIDDVAAEVPPEGNTSVVFVRSAASWHAVTPVTKERHERRSLLFHVTR